VAIQVLGVVGPAVFLRGIFFSESLACILTKTLTSTDRFTQHRYKADQAFQLDASKAPVAQYLDIDNIVKICVANGVEAVHPGYGFLR
jgi:pyruvate carboxylase